MAAERGVIEIPNFSGARVLCVGDVMLDRFISGSVGRISPESPVPILRRRETLAVPGGAANVGRNISALGGCCTLIGAVGTDAVGDELHELLSVCGRIDPILVRDSSRPTIEKIRFVAQGQHLLRVDSEAPGDVSTEVANGIVAEARRRIAGHDVVVLSDYAKGVLTDAVLTELIAIARSAGIPVLADPKSPHLARYAGTTIITPNAKEAREAVGIDTREDHEAERAGRAILSAAEVEAVVLTRAERGISLVSRNGPAIHLPASAREVFDVVGAGDTVVATLALCIARGMPTADAAEIANVAAGLVVGKHGTATVTYTELNDEFVRLNRSGLMTSQLKIVSRNRAASLRDQWARDGLTVGFTNGCFDILHIGHVRILEFARAQCDRLIVAVNDDRSVRRLKGPSRPVNDEVDRLQVIGAFGFVDAVVLFGEDTPYELIQALQPDVLVKGSDYTVEQVVGHDIVEARGGRVVTFDLVPDRSTSRIIARTRASSEDAVPRQTSGA